MVSATFRRVFATAPARFRPIALIAFAAPFALSACVSSQNGMKTTALATKPGGAATTDAYGYAPVRITAFADGSRIALPSQKPDAAKLAAAPAEPVVAPKTDRSLKAPESRAPESAAAQTGAPDTEIAALEADVAERKAETIAADPVAPASSAIVAKAAESAMNGKSARPSAVAKIAEAASALNPVETVPAAVAAVADTAGAVKVAAVETTAKAYDAVADRISDTFGGKDTITGNAAIDRMIEKSAAENGIPSELAYAVVRVESRYNPKAKGSGVYGLSQIQPSTARSLGFSGPTNALFDPETNLRYGMKYLAGAWQKSGHDVCGTAMKYKGGHRTTVMTKSAAAYCANVKRHMAAIERRRGPVNRETIVAANEREKQIAMAGSPADARLRARMPASATRAVSSDRALPGVVDPVAVAASSPSGRSVAASAAPVPTSASESLGAALDVAEAKNARGGRVIQAETAIPVQASLGLD